MAKPPAATFSGTPSGMPHRFNVRTVSRLLARPSMISWGNSFQSLSRTFSKRPLLFVIARQLADVRDQPPRAHRRAKRNDQIVVLVFGGDPGERRPVDWRWSLNAVLPARDGSLLGRGHECTADPVFGDLICEIHLAPMHPRPQFDHS